jgi:hypothetical protein
MKKRRFSREEYGTVLYPCRTSHTRRLGQQIAPASLPFWGDDGDDAGQIPRAFFDEEYARLVAGGTDFDDTASIHQAAFEDNDWLVRLLLL